MTRRIVYGTLGTLLVLLLALGTAARQLAQHEDGARLVAGVLGYVYPQLRVEHRAGSLQQADFARILWEDAERRVELRDIRWRLDPRCLSWGKLCFEELSIASLTVELLSHGSDRSPFALSPVRTPLPLGVQEGRVAELSVLERGEQRVRIEALALAGEWRGSRVTLERASARLGELALEAGGTIALRGRLPLSVAGRLRWAEREPIAVSAKGDLGELALSAHGDAALPFEASGSVDVLARPATLAFTARQRAPLSQEWPQLGTVQLSDATAQANGTWQALALQLDARIDSALLGSNHLQASGRWSEAEAAVEHARLAGALGELLGTFHLQRADGAWRAGLQLTDACPPGWRPGFECRLSGTVDATGALDGRADRLAARVALEGSVNGLPAALDGQIGLDAAGRLAIEELRLQSGGNSLALRGSAGERLALDGELQVRALGDTVRDASGTGTGRIRIEGERGAPRLRGDLALRQLSVAGMRAARAELRAQWQGAEDGEGSVEIALHQGAFGKRTFASAQAQLAGGLRAQALQASLGGKRIALALDCSGGAADADTWHGRCNTLTLGDSAASAWQLEKPLVLHREAATAELVIEPFCLRREAATLCGERPVRLGRGGALEGLRLRGSALPLALLEDSLPQGLQAAGSAELFAEAARPAGGPLRLSARLTANELSLVAPAAGEDVPLALRGLELTLEAADGSTRIGWQAAVGAHGSTRGALAVEGSSADAALSGRMELADVDLGALLRETPGTLAASATLDGVIAIGGQLATPRVEGALQLRDGSLVHERLPQALEAVQLRVEFAGAQARISGRVGSGVGEIGVDGEATWEDAGWQARLRLHADELLLEPLRGSTLAVSPDLLVELWPQRARVSGSIAIPSARINLESLPETAVRVSDDAVVFGAPEPATQFEYALDVAITLGKSVRFRGLGVDARLGGELRLEQQPGQPLNGTGELNVLEGRYRAYGQRLEITEGQLLFRGPLDDPALRITAVRRIEDEQVTVGVRVRGNARVPELSVFSRPAMAESKALHYLLTGQAPIPGDDSGMVGAGAAVQLGLAGANRVTGGVMSKFGIEDFEMGSRQTEEGQEVHLGGYISPRLYLRYGVSTFDKIYTFRLRYRLTPKVFVEAVSGIEQAIDLLYSFER